MVFEFLLLCQEDARFDVLKFNVYIQSGLELVLQCFCDVLVGFASRVGNRHWRQFIPAFFFHSLFKQLLRFVRVEFHQFARFVAEFLAIRAFKSIRDKTVSRFFTVFRHVLDDVILVHRISECLADFFVREWFFFNIVAVEIRACLVHHAKFRRVLQLLGHFCRHAGYIQFARFIHLVFRVRVIDHSPVDFIQFHVFSIPILFVLLENEFLVVAPRSQVERPVSDKAVRFCMPVRVFCCCRFVDREEAWVGDDVQERFCRFCQFHDEGLVAFCRNRNIFCSAFSIVIRFRAFNEISEERCRRSCFRVQHMFPCIDEIARCDRFAVRPVSIFTDVECVRQPVFRDVDRFSSRFDRLG